MFKARKWRLGERATFQKRGSQKRGRLEIIPMDRPPRRTLDTSWNKWNSFISLKHKNTFIFQSPNYYHPEYAFMVNFDLNKKNIKKHISSWIFLKRKIYGGKEKYNNQYNIPPEPSPPTHICAQTSGNCMHVFLTSERFNWAALGLKLTIQSFLCTIWYIWKMLNGITKHINTCITPGVLMYFLSHSNSTAFQRSQ